ncbi:MAG: hypothetical protein FWD48_07000 [Oscillospiraceae bacterium]|nr:hypothetical protein [Oscillospiraceae bacterium]
MKTVIGFDNKEHEVVTEPKTECESYVIDEIFYHAENHLVVGTSAHLYPLLRMAKAVGARAYGEKYRKTTGLPYEDHLTEVYRLCSHYKFSHGNDAMYAAAVLHDYLEDAVKRGNDQKTTTQWMKTTFGYPVTTLVVEMTNDKKNEEGLYPKKDGESEVKWINKIDYINWKLSNMSSEAFFLKLLDMLSNLGDADTLPKLVQRIRSQMNYINDNMETLFLSKLSTDHKIIIGEINRILREIYKE